MNRQLESLSDFYLPQSSGELNLFEIWEGGGARGDSITPATHSPAYRTWMHDKIVNAMTAQGTNRLLSLGCGNATIEGVLVGEGYQVTAVDALAEAVRLAAAKGVESIQADITHWTPQEHLPVIYMDGVLGHLYEPSSHSLLPILERIRSWLDGSATDTDGRGGTLIASNDSTSNGNSAQAAPGVTGFHWLTVEFMRLQALAAGFDRVEAETFTYERPMSGTRVRSVITSHVLRQDGTDPSGSARPCR